MKKLIISIKSTSSALDEITKRLKKVQAKKTKAKPHYEISFTEMKDFKRFISNIDMLTSIYLLKPKSIYDLANIMQKDVGNINRLLNFFNQLGAIDLQEKKVDGRIVKRPVVRYQKIEFDLVA